MAADERPTVLAELHALRAAALDWRLSRGDIGTFAVLLKHADSVGHAYPGPALIAKEAQLAVSNVKASLKRLEAFRYIRVERPGLRKANRYWILASPNVPSLKRTLQSRQMRKELGMPTGPALGMRTGPVPRPSRAATRPADRTATGPADRSELGMRTGHELALNSPLNSLEQLSSTEEEPERSPEAEQRMTERARALYLVARERGQQELMDQLEQNHRHRIEDLIARDEAA